MRGRTRTGAEARAGGAARLALARRRAIGAMVAPRLRPALGRLRLRLDDDVALSDGFEWGIFLAGNTRGKRPSRKEVRKGTGPFPEVHGFHDEVWERTQRAASLFDDDHGFRRFAGADYKRNATKWRCPTGECKPASIWVKADRLHPLIPRETLRWRALYKRRGAVEREFGRLKNEWALAPLRVRRIERVRLHADLTILAKLSCALARARAAPLAA